MNDNADKETKVEQSQKNPVKRPNETGSVYIEAHIKIFDPNTNDVLVEKRA